MFERYFEAVLTRFLGAYVEDGCFSREKLHFDLYRGKHRIARFFTAAAKGCFGTCWALCRISSHRGGRAILSLHAREGKRAPPSTCFYARAREKYLFGKKHARRR